MSPAETIVFNPSIPDRELDREASKVDKRLAESGQIQPEIGDVEGELGLGELGGGGMGGDGLGIGGAGGAGGAAGLASKIPKPVAGVTAAAALPVALAGGVGIGLLSAMSSASARLQTQGKLLGIAVDNFFREPGNILAESFQPAVDGILDLSTTFDENMRELSDVFPDGFGDEQMGVAIAAAVTEELTGVDLAARIADFEWPNIDDMWPGWPSIDTEWPGWPSINTDWPGWPSIDTTWPGWPNIKGQWGGWPDIGTPSWPSSGQILAEFPSLSVSDLRNQILGNDSGGSDTVTLDPGDTSGGTFDPPRAVPGDSGGGGGGFDVTDPGSWFGGFQRGGVINRPTPVMAGEAGPEVITPVAELRRMMEGVAQQQSGGGGNDGGGMDREAMRPVENKLDRLNRNITQLAQAMQSMSIEVDGETLGRAAAKGQRENVTDTDPLVR